MEIKKIENRKIIKKINSVLRGQQNWQTISYMNKEKEKTQINKIRNESGGHYYQLHRDEKEYNRKYKQLYSNKLVNPNKWIHFMKQKLVKLTREEIF